MPLYLAGAEFLSFHPLSIITHGLGLNITVQTYAGQVYFGIIADKKVLPYADDLAKAIELAFTEAQAFLALTQAIKAPAKKSVAQVTQKLKLQKSDSVKARPRRDTVLTSNTAPKSNASNHGKSVIKKTAGNKTVKRKNSKS